MPSIIAYHARHCMPRPLLHAAPRLCVAAGAAHSIISSDIRIPCQCFTMKWHTSLRPFHCLQLKFGMASNWVHCMTCACTIALHDNTAYALCVASSLMHFSDASMICIMATGVLVMYELLLASQVLSLARSSSSWSPL